MTPLGQLQCLQGARGQFIILITKDTHAIYTSLSTNLPQTDASRKEAHLQVTQLGLGVV